MWVLRLFRRSRSRRPSPKPLTRRATRVRTPTVLQMEASECGAASLGIILGYYSKYIPLEELRVACGVSRDGTNAWYIREAGKRLGLIAKAKRASNDLDGLSVPLIAFWENNHFLVVEGKGQGFVYLNDPATGPRTVSQRDFERSFSKIVLTFEPGPTFSPSGRKPSLLQAVRRRLHPARGTLGYIILAGLILVAPILVSANFGRVFIDEILLRHQYGWFRPLLWAMLATAVVRVVLIRLQQSHLRKLEIGLALGSSVRFLSHCLKLPIEFFQSRFAGEVSSRVGLNNRISQLLSGELATTVVNLLLIVLYARFMIEYDVFMTFVGVGIGSLNILVIRYFARWRIDENLKVQQLQGRLLASLMWAIQIIETIKAGGSEPDILARWSGYQARMVTASQRLGVATAMLLVLPPMFATIISAVILGMGGARVMQGSLSIGMLIAFQTLMASFIQPVNDLVRLGAASQDMEADLTRLDDVLVTRIDPVFAPAEINPGAAADPTRRLVGHVELRDVTFGYNRLDEPLIKELNLTIKPGSRIAIVGASGSGKSTIGRLVSGLYRPWSGSILIDGRPRNAFPRAVLSRSIAMVDESILLFEGTVRDNLSLWDQTVPDELLVRAAIDACIHQDMILRPGGYAARVAEGGRNFSGGQRQRLELARALARDPSILILDEATSALDPRVEERVDDHLRRRGCTCLIIAHRLSTIRDCDQIIVLKDGRVVERGTHDSLLDANGAYAALRLGREVVRMGYDADDWREPHGRPTVHAPRILPSARALARVLEHEGRSLELSGRQPFLINDPRSVWLVLQGRVDLFLVDIENREPVGERRHLFRVDELGAMFGFGGQRRRDRVGLLAVGTPGTRVFQIHRETLVRMARDEIMREDISELLDDWIHKVFHSIHDKVPPRNSRRLKPGQRLELAERMSASTYDQILWVEHISGNTRLLGDPMLPILDDSRLTPLDPSSWLVSEGPCELHAYRTDELLSKEHLWASLDTFHQLALQQLARNRLRAETERRERVRSSHRRERILIQGHLHRLRRILGLRGESPALDEADPLHATCRLVAEASGITITDDRVPKGRQMARDPLGSYAWLHGFRVRRVSLRDDWWTSDAGPLLGWLAENRRPVALLPTSDSSYELVDTVKATREPVNERVSSQLGPYAHVFYRTLPRSAITFADLIRFGLNGLRPELLTAFFTGLAAGWLGLCLPVLTGVVIDTVIPAADFSRLSLICFAIAVIAMGIAGFRFVQGIAILRIEGKMSPALLPALWDRLLNLPTRFFSQFTSGDLALRALGMDQLLRGTAITALASILSSSFSFLNILLLFYYNWRMALVACLLVVLSFATTLAILTRLVRHQSRIREIEGAISSMLLEFLSGIAKLRVAGAEDRAFARWAARYGEQLDSQIRARGVSNLLVEFQAAYPLICSMVLFSLMSQIGFDSMSTGEFIAFMIAFGSFMSASMTISSSLASIMNLVPTYERLRPILQATPERQDDSAEPFSLEGKIELSGVTFRYEADGPPILRGIDLTIQPGEFVAFVGPSGSGKSTLFRLLLGFETPESGKVAYDGRDLTSLDLREVRRQLGVVMQNAQIMPGDLFTNIVGLSTNLTMDDAWEAARMAGLADDIEQMPMKLHTIINEGGSTFSGGQRQRLLIAAAIAKRPRILLFDEATSALDNQSQAVVSRSLETLQATRVVISHRLSTIVAADRIHVIDRGRIVQSGTYDQLLQEGGLFGELARRQLA